MAQYKVPQDVEADDKLIGPFSFRQFVYLLVAGALVAVAVGLFQIFPLLAIIPVPPILLMLALALPIKKDQPMDTYLAAIVSYYLKPRTRKWVPGQRESTILITAPKVVDEGPRTRDISGEEATHRLSFLADIVDTEGYAIKGAGRNSMREDLIAEANAVGDMFDNYQTNNLTRAMEQEAEERHAEALEGMKKAIERSENELNAPLQAERLTQEISNDNLVGNVEKTEVEPVEKPVENSVVKENKDAENVSEKPIKHSIIELANNPDFSVATIAKEANRINRKDDEVFISLH